MDECIDVFDKKFTEEGWCKVDHQSTENFIIGILTDLTSLEVVLFGMGMLAIIIPSGFLFFSSSVRNQP